MASTGAGFLAMTSVIHSAFAYGQTAPAPFPGPIPTTEVMGATGLSDPTQQSFYWQAAQAYAHTFFPGSNLNPVVTPEDLAPWTGVNSMTLDQSEAEGLDILNRALSPLISAGTPTGVLGVSQSADISSLEMEKLDPAGTPSSLPASFVLLGDELNPNGGMLSRFPGLNMASIGVTFGNSTPSDDFPTVVYTHEYDGFSDFCQYPIDTMCDVNALIGIAFNHSYTGPMIPSAFELPTEGPTLTTYYMIPSQLPLTELISDIPNIGKPLAALLGPDLSAIVNLGYGDPDYGYSTGPANITTPFGFLPSVSDFEKFFQLLQSGTAQGIQNFTEGIANGSFSNPFTSDVPASSTTDVAAPSATPDPVTGLVNGLLGSVRSALTSLPGGGIGTDPLTGLTDSLGGGTSGTDPITSLLSPLTALLGNSTPGAGTDALTSLLNAMAGSLTSLFDGTNGTFGTAALTGLLSGLLSPLTDLLGGGANGSPPLITPAELANDFSPGALGNSIIIASNHAGTAANLATAFPEGTEQFAEALAIAMPAYDLDLFLTNLSNPIDAIGLPIAADMAISSIVAGFELLFAAEDFNLLDTSPGGPLELGLPL
ncbi:MAG TPA: PE-PPE domain-containing protein [Mycobacterium sp.]|nr:PE-PPE domain-containing protein [Mycobacterium sp.]